MGCVPAVWGLWAANQDWERYLAPFVGVAVSAVILAVAGKSFAIVRRAREPSFHGWTGGLFGMMAMVLFSVLNAMGAHHDLRYDLLAWALLAVSVLSMVAWLVAASAASRSTPVRGRTPG